MEQMALNVCHPAAGSELRPTTLTSATRLPNAGVLGYRTLKSPHPPVSQPGVSNDK